MQHGQGGNMYARTQGINKRPQGVKVRTLNVWSGSTSILAS